MKKKRNFKQLSEFENNLLSQLVYYPEDKDEKVNHTFKNNKAKILAIAIFDVYYGSKLNNDLVRQIIYKDIYKKLFNKNIETLFTFPKSEILTIKNK